MGFGSAGDHQDRYARQLAGSLGYLAVQQGDAVGLSCVAEGHRAKSAADAQSGPPAGDLRFAGAGRAAGRNATGAVLHELAETIRQRALIVIISDLFVEPELLRGCFQHLRFRKHDVAVFHLLDPLELKFNFRRPMRFLDMEGGPAIFAEPERDRRPLSQGTRHVPRRPARRWCWNRRSTYHRVSIDDDYEQVLGRFLVGRTR